jgi:polyisoprenoid-binding protein YceI
MSALPADLTGTWDIDPVHTTIGFSAKHAVVATTRGQFTTYTGGAVIDAAAPENSSLFVDIDAASITTNNDMRDGHLKSADFLNVEQFPKLTYKSTKVSVDGDEIHTSGDLTIAGVTHPVDLVWEFGGIAKDPYGTVKAGFETSTTINRKDWGLVWNAPLETGGLLVGEKVKLTIEIEANKQA